MPSKAAKKSKREALKRHGALNPHPNAVIDPLFETGDFFDRNDLVQVKYEMLRRVQKEGRPVSTTAAAFGFSRPSYYQAQSAFEQAGLAGLIPQKRGPKAAHKLTPEILEFLQQARQQNAALRTAQLGDLVQQRFQRLVHPRTIERALARSQKKRRRRRSKR